RGTAFAAVLAGLPVLALAVGGDTAIRVRREHGLQLPASARHFDCRGDAWLPILDRAAIATFEIARADLASLTNQLKMHKPDSYGELLKDRHPKSIATYYCDSATGDFLFVDLWLIGEDRVGVWLYTDWN